MSSNPIEEGKPDGHGREGRYPWAMARGMKVDEFHTVEPGERHRTESAAARYAATHPPMRFKFETRQGVIRCYRTA